MGKINAGILGGFSGNVGNVVGSSWKGIAYMKRLPASVANPRTAGQVAQRLKMSTIVLLTQFILNAWVRPLCNGTTPKMSGFNWFVKHNIPFVSSAGVVDDASFVPCNGPMAGTPITSAINAAGTVTVVFPNTLDGEYQSANDIAYVLVIDGVSKQAHATHGALRSTGTIAIVLPAAMAGNTATSTLYLAFKGNEPLIRPVMVSDPTSHAIA
jgi:hypothetical protein